MENKPEIDREIIEEDKLKAQILGEINKLIVQYPPMIKGDISIMDIAEDRKTSRQCAYDFARKLVRLYPNKYEMAKVRLDASNITTWKWVIRRK